MSATTVTPETLHAHILDVYGQHDLTMIESLGSWIIGIDRNCEPPLVTLTEVSTATIIVLDGQTIQAGPKDYPPKFYEYLDAEKAALSYLNKLFGR